MGAQHYCLRWNNHQPNFISVFKNLLDLEELVDVTLSVEGQYVKAHKLILSACSPYFKLLFSVTPAKHPSIILNDIKFADLKTILEFMYCGEISISEDRLPNILEVAELLQVRGLFDPNKKEEETAERQRKIKMETNEPEDEDDNQVLNSNVELSDGNESNESSNPSGWMLDNSFSSADASSPTVEAPSFSPNTNENSSFNGAVQLHQSMPPVSSHLSSPATPSNPIKRRRSSKVQESANFHMALEAVRTGQLGFCKAAKLYGLNNRTLWLEYKKRGYPKTRSQPVGLKNKSNLLENTSRS